MLVTFSQAASHLGHRSRSTLYRLRADGRLQPPYLAPGAGDHGADLIELTPAGRPSFRQWIEGGILGPQGPLAARLRRARAAAPEVPETPAEADGAPARFGLWGPEPDSWGGWRPDEVLTADEELLHALAMALGLAGLDIPDASVAEAAECLPRCLQAVAAGGRWDREVWTRRLIETAVDGLEDGGADDITRAELEGYLHQGLVPPDLVGAVHRALGR